MLQQRAMPYFDSALPDEHYMAYLWRCANLSGYVTLNKMLQGLTGRCPQYVSGLLTSKYLADILTQLPEYISAEAFMRHHTQEKYFTTIDYNREENEKFKSLASINRGGIVVKHLRWCHACTKQDAITLNLRYWHNSHQDPRITRCQKHGLQLISVCNACREKEINTSKFGLPPEEAVCQLCGVSLNVRRVESLTPFQHWMEQLHHLSNHGVNVSRVALLKRASELISKEKAALQKLPPFKRKTPEKRFIEAYNKTLAHYHFALGAVSYEHLSSYSHLQLKTILNSDKFLSPVIYALLGWVFLDADERDARYGFFDGGKAILKVQ